MNDVVAVNASEIDSWVACGAVRDYSARHLRAMVAWLRGTRADRPLRAHEAAMLAGYEAELGRRGLTSEEAA